MKPVPSKTNFLRTFRLPQFQPVLFFNRSRNSFVYKDKGVKVSPAFTIWNCNICLRIPARNCVHLSSGVVHARHCDGHAGFQSSSLRLGRERALRHFAQSQHVISGWRSITLYFGFEVPFPVFCVWSKGRSDRTSGLGTRKFVRLRNLKSWENNLIIFSY